MPSFKNLEMAAALSADHRIVIKKSLFGQKAVFQPTGSPMEVSVQEYTPDGGARLERLLHLPIEKIGAEVAQHGVPQPTPVGQYRLEVCRSKDGQFVALQLFRFADFVYHTASPLLSLEGADVAQVAGLL